MSLNHSVLKSIHKFNLTTSTQIWYTLTISDLEHMPMEIHVNLHLNISNHLTDLTL